MKPDVRVFPDITAVSRAAAEIFVETAGKARWNKGGFSVALSGGRTPLSFFELMSSDGYAWSVDWDAVHVFWADERCVLPDNPESNYGNAVRLMLGKLPIPPANICRVKAELQPDLAAHEYEMKLKRYFGTTGREGFDLCLLGMGEDGHTASLFPGSGAVAEDKRLAVPVYVEARNSWRVSITLPVINNSARVVFMVSGREKAEAVRGVLGETGATLRLPAGLVRPFDGELIWLIDEGAAGLIKEVV